MTKMQDETSFTDADGSTCTLTVSKLEPVDAYLVVAKLGKVIVPAVVALKQGKLDAEMQPMIDRLFDGLSPQLALELLYDLLRTAIVVKVDAQGNHEKYDLCGGKLAINRAFAGNLKMMFKAMRFAFEVNFGDFFDVSGLVGKLTPTPSA